MKRTLIIGIDPGTTVGYACLDHHGAEVLVGSKRNMSFSELISLLIGSGRPLIIGTDKKSLPSYIKKAASNLGAKALTPPDDLTHEEKRALVATKCGDAHSFDALAAARYAYDQVKATIAKVEKYFENNSPDADIDKVLELVLLHEVNIRQAISLLQPKPLLRVVAKKSLDAVQSQKGPDISGLYALIEELTLKNEQLSRKLKSANQHVRGLKKKLRHEHDLSDEQVESSNTALHNKVKDLQSKTEQESLRYSSLLDLLALPGVIAKKLPDLTTASWNLHKPSKGDVLLVDRPDISTDPVLKKAKECTVIKRTPSVKVLAEVHEYAKLDQKWFEKHMQRSGILDKVLSEYKRERESTRP